MNENFTSKVNRGFCEVLFRNSDEPLNLDLRSVRTLNLSRDYHKVGSIIPTMEIETPYDVYKMALHKEFTKVDRPIQEYDVINILFPEFGLASYIVLDVLSAESDILKSKINVSHINGFRHGLYRIPYKFNKFKFQST